jgi:hypothetical protein
MPSTQQLEFKAGAGGQSQCAKIFARLVANLGEWVPMPELADLSGSYAVNSRVADLRKRGHKIEHKNEHQPNGSIHSFYRLLPTEETP